MTSSTDKLIDWWREAKHVVFFGGAGVSTASGVPDFRSADGIYSRHQNAEEILTPGYMKRNPEAFYRFCREYFLTEGIKPNAAHEGLAKLEEAGKLDLVITQNIDGLHQMAGSRRVIELHGNARQYSCLNCGRVYDADYVKHSDLTPRCNARGLTADDRCRGMLRPDIVLYEEMLNPERLQAAGQAISGADLLIIGGSSLQVWPAASLIDYLSKGHLVVINRDATVRDRQADLVIREPIAEVFSEIVEKIMV